MKSKDLLKLSTRMFKARTSRTILTILGMGVGISAILFLVSLGYGLQRTLLEKITTSDSLLSLDVSSAEETLIKIDTSLIEKITEFGGISEISPAMQLNSQISLGELTSDIEALITKPSFLKLDGLQVDEGNQLNNEDTKEIIVTSSLAKIFKKEIHELLGKEVNLTIQIPKKIQNEKEEESILKEKESESIEIPVKFKIAGYVESDNAMIYVNIDEVNKYTEIPYFSRIKVKCENSDFLDSIKKKLLELGLSVSSLSETVEQTNQVFKVLQVILALFGIIALIVSAIGMFNTMTVTLLERTEEIGIMKSIGVSDTDILMMFVFESSIMGFFGGLAGIMIAILGGKAFNFLLNSLAQKFGGESVNLFYSPLWFIGLILFLATFVGFLTGLIPARRGASIDPLDALRYK